MVLTRSMGKTGKRAMTKLKRVLRYLKGAVDLAISFGREEGDDGRDWRVLIMRTKRTRVALPQNTCFFWQATFRLEITKANCCSNFWN